MQSALDGRGLIRARRDDDFFADVIAGLGSQPKSVPGKWLWDERGTRLFERVGDAPEHYLGRAERALLDAHGREIAALIGPRCRVIEHEPADAARTLALVARLEEPVSYVPIDAGGRLEALARVLRSQQPSLAIAPRAGGLDEHLAQPDVRTVVWTSLATFAAANPHDAVARLARAARVAGRGGLVLVSVDLHKPKALIEAAYDDRRGAFAAFHRNLLVRINREIGATFDVTRFAHRAPYDPIRGQVELRLVSDAPQRVRVRDREVAFARGEWIVTGRAHKYDPCEVAPLARRARLESRRWWIDPARRVSLHAFAATGGEGHARA